MTSGEDCPSFLYGGETCAAACPEGDKCPVNERLPNGDKAPSSAAAKGVAVTLLFGVAGMLMLSL